LFDRCGGAKIAILEEGRREGGREGWREEGRSEVMISSKREHVNPTPTKRKKIVRACSIRMVGENSPY
jgi:hypothetical protein